MNIERPTSNVQRRMAASRGIVQRSVFGVQCSVFVFAAVFFAADGLYGQAPTNTLPALAPPYSEIPLTFWEQQGTTVFVVGVTLIVLAVLILWKLFQPRPAVILPPEFLAREALEKLLSQPEDGKRLSEVSQTLCRYVIAAFELSPGEFTTTEFCAELAGSEKIGSELAQTISDFLRECDGRKFSPAGSTAPFNAATRAMGLVDLAEKRRRPIPAPK